MDIINSLSHESLAEYRRSIVRKSFEIYPHLLGKSEDEIVNNCMFFPALWLDIETYSYSGFPDLWDIFKPYGDLTYYTVKKEFWNRRHKQQRKNARLGKPIKAEPDRKIFTPKQRFEILKRDNYRCTICGRSAADGVKLQVDHVHPKSKGGMAIYKNGATLCQECNIGKTDTVLEVSYLEVIGTH